MNYFLYSFWLGKIVWLIVIMNCLYPLHAAEIFVNNVIDEYKTVGSPLALVIGSQDYYGKEILELLPLAVRNKVYKLEWTYSSYNAKIPSNLGELFPNLIAIKTGYYLPENLKLLFGNYKYFRWYDSHTKKWIKHINQVPAHAFYEGENRIENNIINLPGEENLLESNFSIDEVLLLAGEKPQHHTDEQDYAHYFDQGDLIIVPPTITPLEEKNPLQGPYLAHQPVYHPPLEKGYGTTSRFDPKELSSLYLPITMSIVEAYKESQFALGNRRQIDRRKRSHSETSAQKETIDELIDKNPLYAEVIRKFFGQINYGKNAPKTVSPAIIPVPGPPGTGKTYVIKQLIAKAGVPIQELKFHMQKGDITLPIKSAIDKMAEPEDARRDITNVIFFDEIQNLMGEDEIITKIKYVKILRDILEEKKKEYKDNAKSIGDNKDNINLHNQEIKKAEENYERELKNIKDIIAKKEETYFLLQETFGTGYFTKNTKQSVGDYVQLFTDYAGTILTIREKKKETLESLDRLEKAKERTEEKLKKLRSAVAEDEEKDLASKTEQLRKLVEEQERDLGKYRKELLEIENSLKAIKGPLSVSIKELQEDYPRLLASPDEPKEGNLNEPKEANLIANKFMKTPALFLKNMQTQSRTTQAQSKWCINRTIVFLAANNHALIARVNARFNSAQNKKQHINPEEYRKVYEEEINNQELQDMVLKKFTYYDGKAALNEFLGLVTEEVEQETSISSRLNIENFKEKLPPGKQEWHQIIRMQLQNITKTIAEELNHGGVGRVSVIEETGQNLEEADLTDDITFTFQFGEKLVDYIYQKTTGNLGFRTFIPKFNELLQGFDDALKMAIFELQENYEKEFLSAVSHYFNSHSETEKSLYRNDAYDAQRKIYSLKNLTIELGDTLANPVIVVKTDWQDDAHPQHVKILEFPIVFAEEAAVIKDAPAQDSLPFANEVAAMLVLGMSKFLSPPNPNIDLSACSVDADFIPKLWPDRTISNFSYIYRKLMTSLGAIAVARRLNNNVIAKEHSGYYNHLKRNIDDLRHIFIKNEQEKNLRKKNKLPLHEVIGDNLSQIILFQKIYNSDDENEIMQYLFDDAVNFVDFYQNIINAIAQEIVRKRANGSTLSFTSDEMQYLIKHYWPGTDYIERREQIGFLDWLWWTKTPAVDFSSHDIVNGKIKNALLSNPEGCSNVLLCENENIPPKKVRKSQGVSLGFGGFAGWLGCFPGNPFELIQFSANERRQHGFVPPECIESESATGRPAQLLMHRH